MKVHHCFIRLIQHYKFYIFCQFPPLSHKPYDKLHTLLKFPNLDNITYDKNEGLSPLKAGQMQVVTRMAITSFFFLNLNDKALEVLGARICPLLLQWEAEITSSSRELQRGQVEGPHLRPQPCPAFHWHESWTRLQPASWDPDVGTPWLGHLSCSKCGVSIRPLRCSSHALKLWSLWPLSHDSWHFGEERRTTSQEVGKPGNSRGVQGITQVFLHPAVTCCCSRLLSCPTSSTPRKSRR